MCALCVCACVCGEVEIYIITLSHTLSQFDIITYPTLGKPTMPHLREVPNLPRRGPGPSSAPFFLGGILASLYFERTTRSSCQ